MILFKKSEKDNKTIDSDDFKNYPPADEKMFYHVFRNKRDDLWVKRNIINTLKKIYSDFIVNLILVNSF